MVDKVILWGGIGEKTSNKGTQFYIQDRIYDSEGISPALNTFCPYWIVIRNNGGNNSGC